MFPYCGDIEGLNSALTTHREAMERAYRAVLGSRYFQVVQAQAASLLGDTSFFDLEVLREFGMSAGNHNKFITMSGYDELQFRPDGHFTTKDGFRVGPGFIFTQKGFDLTTEKYDGWIDPYLAPYIHEYNHFVIFALQQIPFAIAEQVLLDGLAVKSLPIQPSEIEIYLAEKGGTRDELCTASLLAVFAYLIHNMNEHNTRMLDIEIFKQMGIEVSDDYFVSKPKQAVAEYVSLTRQMLIWPTGDVLHGKPLQSRLPMLEEWDRKMRGSLKIHNNYAESLRALAVRKEPILGMLEEFRRYKSQMSGA